jgi:hypothetical protein
MSVPNVPAWTARTRSESPVSALHVVMSMAQHMSLSALRQKSIMAVCEGCIYADQPAIQRRFV